MEGILIRDEPFAIPFIRHDSSIKYGCFCCLAGAQSLLNNKRVAGYGYPQGENPKC